MRFVKDSDFGNTLVEELNKLEISLKDTSITDGLLLDYGLGIKEYLCTISTRFTKTPVNMGSGRYVYYDFFNHTIPITFIEVLNVQANLTGSDLLLMKQATGKSTASNIIRVDYSGNANRNNISDQDKQVVIYLRILGRVR